MFTEAPTWGVTRNPWNTERGTAAPSGGSGAASRLARAAATPLPTEPADPLAGRPYCYLSGSSTSAGRVRSTPDVEHWARDCPSKRCLTRSVLRLRRSFSTSPPAAASPREEAAASPALLVERRGPPPGKLRWPSRSKGVRALPHHAGRTLPRTRRGDAKLLGSWAPDVCRREPDWGAVGKAVAIL